VPPGQAELAGTGLNGEPLNLRILAALPAVPGAPANGIIVDRRYAELAAGFDLLSAGHQVWLGAGALPVIRPKLLASGVRILSVRSISGVVAELNRQGPALATALYLADAAAAALLAAGTAILGVYVSAHRRRYEYAALAASGTSLRTLRTALRIELAFVLGFGVLVGTATGLVAARFVLSSVPEFTSVPAEPPLSYVPALGPLAGLLVAAVALPLIAAAVSSTTLIRGVKPELLRETPA
jgi:hypothetical protein